MSDDERASGDARRAVVSREHRRLDELFSEVEASFAAHADPDAVRDAFAALCEQLDVHFEQEDRLYYATVGTLRPELAPQIRSISDAHRSFRSEIGAIRDLLERTELPAARQRISALVEAFRRHEAMEETLLERIEATIQQVPVGGPR